MEVTQRFIGIRLALLIASSSAQIIVQPGYSQPSYGQQVHTGSPRLKTPMTYEQSSLSLADEFHRNQLLQRMVEGQVLQMLHERQAQQVQPIPRGVVRYPLHPGLGGRSLIFLSPLVVGLPGSRIGGYETSRPSSLFNRPSDIYMQSDYPGKTQWPRSVSGGSGTDFEEVSKVHDVASESSVDDGSSDGVDDLSVPRALVVDDSTDKQVEPRHTGQSDSAIVGSPLDGINYDQPHNHDQHHPMDSPGMSSQFMKSAHAIGQAIDTVAPGLLDPRPGHENKNPMPSMTRQQNLSGKNYQLPQHHQPLSRQGDQSESSSNRKAPTTSSNNQPMTGQSHNSQQPQNSGGSSMTPVQISQNPSAKASGNYPYFQQAPAAYPAAKHVFSGQPGYQNYNQPGYNNHQAGYNYHQAGYNDHQAGYNEHQLGYQSYQNRPQTGGYQPNPNGPFSNNYGSNYPNGPSSNNYASNYPNGPSSTATGSANSSPNNYNLYNPYQQSSYTKPYAGTNPNGISGAVGQFGQTVLSHLPSAVNSLFSNPNNMKYLRNMGQQIPDMLKRPFGY